MKRKIIIIIPAYNEGSNIQKVLHELRTYNPNNELLVINDGSQDNTQQEAEATGLAKVVSLPNNLGIGGAVQTGFKYAASHNFDIAIQFDGDGQHIASEIQKLINPILAEQCDLCIGSRFIEKTLGFQSTLMRRTGIKIFALLTRILIGQTVMDSTSGFRAYNRNAIVFLAYNYPTDFPEPESIILLGKKDFKIKEVTVEMRARQGGESSIAGLKSAYYMLKVVLSMLMTAWRTQSDKHFTRGK